MTTADPDVRSVVVERDIPYPPEKIWRALTQPHLMTEWLMRNDDFAPVLGHRFRLSGDWGGVDCEVLDIEPHRTLAYRWDYAHDDPLYALRSVVTFTLTPTASGTRLSIEQVGFRPNQKQAYGGAMLGWREKLAALEQVAAGLA